MFVGRQTFGVHLTEIFGRDLLCMFHLNVGNIVLRSFIVGINDNHVFLAPAFSMQFIRLGI